MLNTRDGWGFKWNESRLNEPPVADRGARTHTLFFVVVVVVFSCFFFFFTATPVACGSSQARIE